MDNISKYEAMSKLSLRQEERQQALEQADILANSLAALDAIDTSGVEPLVSVVDLQNIFRDDIAKKTISRHELLLNAPEQRGGYFCVPKTLEG